MEKQGKFNICFFVLLGFMLSIIIVDSIKSIKLKEEKHKVEIRLEQPYFLLEELNDTIMLQACRYYGIKHPEIVTAQGILESGYFRSNVFKEYNNPFGLYNSRTKDYYKFNHWSDAIIAYKTMIEYKYKGGNYYMFLKNLPYAEDSLYINKVKSIERKIKNENNNNIR